MAGAVNFVWNTEWHRYEWRENCLDFGVYFGFGALKGRRLCFQKILHSSGYCMVLPGFLHNCVTAVFRFRYQVHRRTSHARLSRHILHLPMLWRWQSLQASSQRQRAQYKHQGNLEEQSWTTAGVFYSNRKRFKNKFGWLVLELKGLADDCHSNYFFLRLQWWWPLHQRIWVQFYSQNWEQ